MLTTVRVLTTSGMLVIADLDVFPACEGLLHGLLLITNREFLLRVLTMALIGKSCIIGFRKTFT